MTDAELVLKKFMLDNFDYAGLKKAGMYGREIKKTDYKLQAERICYFFGYDSVFEYCQTETRAHLSYVDPKPDDKFITVFPIRAMIPKKPPVPTESK